jgi:hypothetical protein
LTAKVSLPATAGALAVHVNVPLALLHAGSLGVRFVAIAAGLPVNAVPFTVASVMMMDCVLLEINAGVRCTDCALALALGMEIVNVAVVIVGAAAPLLALGPGAGTADDGSVVALPPPPPPQAVSANTGMSCSERRMLAVLIVPARSAS